MEMHDTWMNDDGTMMTAEEIEAEKKFYRDNHGVSRYAQSGYEKLMKGWNETPLDIKITYQK